MMKKILFFAVLLFCFLTSCSKGTTETVVKATPSNVALSQSANVPYHVTVQAEAKGTESQAVFSSDFDKDIYATFEDALKDSSFVLIGVVGSEIITAKKLKK